MIKKIQFGGEFLAREITYLKENSILSTKDRHPTSPKKKDFLHIDEMFI
jgi:hypothetical protein